MSDLLEKSSATPPVKCVGIISGRKKDAIIANKHPIPQIDHDNFLLFSNLTLIPPSTNLVFS